MLFLLAQKYELFLNIPKKNLTFAMKFKKNHHSTYLSEELVGAGVTGTYEIALVKNTKGQQAFNCHFDHSMKCIDASKLQFEVGEETGRGGQDYVVPFNYDSDKDKLTINFNGKIRTLKRK